MSAHSLNRYTSDQIAALARYKTAEDAEPGRSHCYAVNALLEQAHWPDELPASLQRTVWDLDSAFAKAPKLTEPTIVYRGDGHRLRFRHIETVGETFRNLAYWSTSRVRESAIARLTPGMTKGHGMLLELRLPAGLPVIDLEALEGTGGSEAEYLLPRGVLWTVQQSLGAARGVDRLTQGYFTNIAEIILEASLPVRPVGAE